MNQIYTLPQQFMDDESVPLHWKLYAFINGFWIAGKPIFASNGYFAEHLKCDERTVQKLLEKLEGLDLTRREYDEDGCRFIVPFGKVRVEGGYALPGRGGTPSQGTPTIKTESLTSEAPLRVENEIDESKPTRLPSKPKYPNARKTFQWFPSPQKSWGLNTTELSHGELLFLRGEKAVRGALKFYQDFKTDIFCPQINKPSDLERKWEDLLAFKKKKGV